MKSFIFACLFTLVGCANNSSPTPADYVAAIASSFQTQSAALATVKGMDVKTLAKINYYVALVQSAAVLVSNKGLTETPVQQLQTAITALAGVLAITAGVPPGLLEAVQAAQILMPVIAVSVSPFVGVPSSMTVAQAYLELEKLH